MKTLQIAVIPGDGIGPEVMAPCLRLLEIALAPARAACALNFRECAAGAELYRRVGEALPEDTFEACRQADAILFGAAGLPEVRYPDGREIVPQIELRERLELYAGVRPARSFPGALNPLKDPRASALDFVLVRESTEGLFASRDHTEREGDAWAKDFLLVTRPACERLFRFSFELARRRKAKGAPGRLTCVDKANVLGSMSFFREIFFETARRFPDIEAEARYVDATALDLIRQPWRFDVLVTENLFGDILSDAGAALAGGMGMAPSADIGDRHAVFQPCHGTAPDIAGRGLANPAAMILSGAMMLDWLGERRRLPALVEAGARLSEAVNAAFANGALQPCEIGGSDGAEAIARAVERQLLAAHA